MVESYGPKSVDQVLPMAYVSNTQKLDVTDKAQVQALLRHWIPDIEVIDCTGHKWDEDEFSKGTWSVLRKNQLTKYGKAVRRPRNGFYLAGSDYANGWSGFIDGAIESGSSIGEYVHDYLKTGTSH